MEAANEWEEQAVCRSIGTDFFYPEHAVSVQTARKFCDGCPVAAYCRIAGLGERWGIWGGLAETQRVTLRKAIGVQIPWHAESSYARDMRLLSRRAWRERRPLAVLAQAIGLEKAAAWLGGTVKDARPQRIA